VKIDGRPLASWGPFDTIATTPVPVTVEVNAGPPFVLGRIDSGILPAGVSLQRLGLVAGRPASSATVLAAETGIAEAWRQQGHPLVTIGTRDTIADHRTRTLDVTLHIDPGPVANFGQATVTGTVSVDPNLVLGRAGIGTGPYSSTVTKHAEERLRGLGVFDSVRISTAPALAPYGTIPITIAVSESKRHVIGGSVTYSNTEGLGLQSYWRDRNLFGGAEQFEIRGAISRLLEGGFDPDYDLAGTFKKPEVFDPMTDFTLRLEGYRQTTDAYRVTAVEAETGLNHIFSDTLTGSLSLELARSETQDSATSDTEEHLPLTLTGGLDWDRRDNRFDPTTGFRVQVKAAPSYDFLVSQPSALFAADLTAYRPIDADDRLVVAGRVAASVLAVGDLSEMAADRRIYAGGAGSVRGYGYQNLGPRDASGNALGGRSSLLFSGELRYRINDQFGVVGFVDAGNAFASMAPSPWNLRVSVGAGLRYMTPVGPIRLDLAVPLQRRSGDPALAVYVGLGQAF
jgi:translocation and assembly module TamA